MDYKILQNDIFGKSLKQIVMENRELTKNDIDFLLNPTNEYVENPYKLKNMFEATRLFMNELEEENVVGILVDSDT